MYGITGNFDIGCLNDLYLSEIGVGMYQVALRFQKRDSSGRDTAIYIRGGFSISDNRDNSSEYQADCAIGLANWSEHERGLIFPLIKLLGRHVCGVEVQRERGSIKLKFDEGSDLTILDSNAPQFESFEIRHGDDFYIV